MAAKKSSVAVEFAFALEDPVRIISADLKGKVIGLSHNRYGVNEICVEYVDINRNVQSGWFNEDDLKALEA
jgi:hypothetical protein